MTAPKQRASTGTTNNLVRARTELALATKNVEHARGKLPRRSLPAGRWTLVDEFASDGTRYLVARMSEAMSRRVDALSSREREVASLVANGRAPKLVAYELGLSESTVRVLLSRVYDKLGVENRGDLVRVWPRRSAPDRQH